MKSSIYYFIAFTTLCLTLYSCEGCVKKTTKSVTDIGLDVLEGMTEAIQERADTIGEKVIDASGKLAKGAGKSLNRQLDEHAEDIASAVGKTLVKSLDGLEKGLSKELYNEFTTQEDFCSDVSLVFFGKLKEKGITDARFNILKEGDYTFRFEFCNDNCKTVVLTKTAKHKIQPNDLKYTSISFAFNKNEEDILKSVECVKITVDRK